MPALPRLCIEHERVKDDLRVSVLSRQAGPDSVQSGPRHTQIDARAVGRKTLDHGVRGRIDDDEAAATPRLQTLGQNCAAALRLCRHQQVAVGGGDFEFDLGAEGQRGHLKASQFISSQETSRELFARTDQTYAVRAQRRSEALDGLFFRTSGNYRRHMIRMEIFHDVTPRVDPHAGLDEIGLWQALRNTEASWKTVPCRNRSLSALSPIVKLPN